MKDNCISLFINVSIQCTLDLIIKGIFFLFREILNEFAAKHTKYVKRSSFVKTIFKAVLK
jgi:hypothetical protein